MSKQMTYKPRPDKLQSWDQHDTEQVSTLQKHQEYGLPISEEASLVSALEGSEP